MFSGVCRKRVESIDVNGLLVQSQGEMILPVMKSAINHPMADVDIGYFANVKLAKRKHSWLLQWDAVLQELVRETG